MRSFELFHLNQVNLIFENALTDMSVRLISASSQKKVPLVEIEWKNVSNIGTKTAIDSLLNGNRAYIAIFLVLDKRNIRDEWKSKS